MQICIVPGNPPDYTDLLPPLNFHRLSLRSTRRQNWLLPMVATQSSHTGIAAPPQKLVSWKSIASYFGCDERTAKRWEHERGLPVHRAPGGKRSAVFAFSSELEAWLGTDTPSAPPPPLNATRQHGLIEDGPTPFSLHDSPRADPENTAAVVSPLFWKGASRGWKTGLVAAVATLVVTAVVLRLREPKTVPLPGPATAYASTSAGHIPPPGAQQIYLEGKYFWNLRTADGLARAIDAYTQAIVKDPLYAEAYAGLAESYVLLPQFAHANLDDSFARAETAADRSIALNPNIAAAHTVRGFALFFKDWDIRDSDREFRRALALDPDSPLTHQWYASTLLNRMEGPACLRQIDEALRLNPTSAATAVDAALMHAEFDSDPGAGIRRLRDLESTQPTLLTPADFLKQIDFAEGDYPAYIAELRHVASISRDPDDALMAEAASSGWARGGKTGMLEALAAVRRKAFQQGTESGFVLGQIDLLLGRKAEALLYFRASLNRHFVLLLSMQDCNWARPLAGDPEYAAFFAQIRARERAGETAHPNIVPLSFRLPQ